LDIYFKSTKIAKQFNEGVLLDKIHGVNRAKKIKLRMSELRAAENLGVFLPPYSGPSRCHELVGNRKGQLSMDLDHPYRLLFKPANEPVPRLENGGLDWSNVIAVEIQGIEDTHE
jgi:proteic killer suppression protein